MSWSRS